MISHNYCIFLFVRSESLPRSCPNSSTKAGNGDYLGSLLEICHLQGVLEIPFLISHQNTSWFLLSRVSRKEISNFTHFFNFRIQLTSLCMSIIRSSASKPICSEESVLFFPTIVEQTLFKGNKINYLKIKLK